MCRSISFRLCLAITLVCVVESSSSPVGSSVTRSRNVSPAVFETVHTSNAALFNRLGLSPLRISQGHHKKRLAGPEPPVNFQLKNHQAYGRRHGHKDSHVYIVKLPPSLPYYAVTRPHKDGKNDVKTSANYPVGFQSNGKPGSIYHWNLPIMKKIAEKKRLDEHSKVEFVKQQRDNIGQDKKEAEDNSNEIERSEIPKIQNKKESVMTDRFVSGVNDGPITGDKLHFRNNDKRLNYGVKEFIAKDKNKSYRLEDSLLFKIKPNRNDEHRLIWNTFNDTHNFDNVKQKKHRKKSAMSYYAPSSLRSGSTNLNKNFSGNGKPKAFYVIEKNRKPVYYHPLLP